MAKERKPKHFIKQPTHVGGAAALKKIIRENLRYPEAAAADKVEGTVVIRYTINHKGKVIESKVISGIGYGCDEEAKRLVQLLQFEVPKHRGMNIKFHKKLKIHFRKPKVKKVVKPKVSEQPASTNITYTVTTTKKGDDNSGGYNYTIKF